MSFNIVDLVKDQVKGQLIGHMGNLLGNEGGSATSAVDSIIPALLNGVTATTSTHEGASSLFGAIQSQDDALLDNMGSMLSEGHASTVIESGNTVLSNLFGSGGLGKLAGALSSFTGVSKGGTSSLMGMLTPIILGALKRKVMGEGLDAGALASLLSNQTSNINSAMPQGLSDQLSSAGFLSSIGGARDAVNTAAGSVAGAADGARDGIANASTAVGNARDGVTGAVGGAANSARDGLANASDAVGDTAKKGGSMFRWLLPLAILAGLAWAAFTYLMPGAKDAAVDAAGSLGDGAASLTDSASAAVDATKDAVTDASAAATDAISDATDAVTDAAATATDAATSAVAVPANPAEIGEQISSLFSGATDTLGGITDVDTAKAALPALGELSDKVDSVSGLFASVPAVARGPLMKIAEEGMGKLKPLANKIMEMPGVGTVVTPVLEPMLEKLQEFGG